MAIFGICSCGVKKNLKSGVACFRLIEAEAKAKASFESRPLDENFLAKRATAFNFWLHLLFQDKRWKIKMIPLSDSGNHGLILLS
jgi:hypothetical protein